MDLLFDHIQHCTCRIIYGQCDNISKHFRFIGLRELDDLVERVENLQYERLANARPPSRKANTALLL